MLSTPNVSETGLANLVCPNPSRLGGLVRTTGQIAAMILGLALKTEPLQTEIRGSECGGSQIQTCTTLHTSESSSAANLSRTLVGASLEGSRAPLPVAGGGPLASEEESFEKAHELPFGGKDWGQLSTSAQACNPPGGQGHVLLHLMDLLQRVKDQLLSVDEAVGEFEQLEPGTGRGLGRLLSIESAKNRSQQVYL
jgi:hypothetical protein